MSYRKITVDDREYLYTVGKTHVKIQGMQAVPLAKVGAMRQYPEYCCEFHCEVVGHVSQFAVQPHDIAAYIRHHGGRRE